MSTVNGPGQGPWIPPTTPPGYAQAGGPTPNPAPPPNYLPGQPPLGGVTAGLREVATALGAEGRRVAHHANDRIRRSALSTRSPERAIASGKDVPQVASKAGIFHPLEIHDLEVHSVEGPAGQAAFASGANVVGVINQFGIRHPANIQKLLARAVEGLIYTHGMPIAQTEAHLRQALRGSGYSEDAIHRLLPDIEDTALRGPARWALAMGHAHTEIAMRMGVSDEGRQWLGTQAAVRDIEASGNFTDGNIETIAGKYRVAPTLVITELAHSAIEKRSAVANVIAALRLPETARPRLEAYAVENGPASREVRSGENLLHVAQRYDIRGVNESGLVAAAMNGPVRHELRQTLNQPQMHMAIAQKYGVPPNAVTHCAMQLAVARGMVRPDQLGLLPEEIQRDVREICAMGPVVWYMQRHGVPMDVAARAYGLNPAEINPVVRNGL